MTEARQVDWNPRAEEVLADQIAAYDAMRGQCPVAHGAQGNWTVFGHEDTVRVLDEHESFSNAVSAHVAIPNGMDPPEHTAFRALVDRYFDDEHIAAFEPVCRSIVARHLDGLRGSGTSK